MTDRIHELLNVWFGHIGTADLPTSDRTAFWFGENDLIKQQIIQEFTPEYNQAIAGRLAAWEQSPRGRLGLIILFDQFPRFLHRKSKDAFTHDKIAQGLSLSGIQEKADHALTLIERVFFYMPLVHAEDDQLQEQSIRLFQELVTLSMVETTQIYQLFLAYAYAHYKLIKEFGRFPQRNILLGRESTEEEMKFLKTA